MKINAAFLALTAFSLFACFAELVGAAQETAESQIRGRPNILLILADDLGKEWVPLYGGEDVGMPNLEKLAMRGAVFDNVYVNPQCTPTRLSLLTGQYPFRHGWVNHWDVPRWGHGYYDWQLNPSLGLALQAAGYATAAAGKWQINDFRVMPDAMEKHGFNDYLMWTGYEAGNPPSGERYWDPYLHGKNGSRTYPGEFGADIFTDFLIAFIEQNKDQPWFAYYAMALPHIPFTHTPAEINAEGDEMQFRAMIRYIDILLGRFAAALDRLGERDDTIIIWIADNGSDPKVVGRLNGREIRGAKSLTTEPGINVPAVISAPGLTSGSRLDALIDITDFFPTLVELAGGLMPEGFEYDGISFASLIKGETRDSERQWIMSMGGQNYARVSEQGVENEYIFRDRVIRDKRYKLYVRGDRKLGFGPPELQFEKLVDLAADPEEKINLLFREARSPEASAALIRLSEIAKQFPERDSDPRYRTRAANIWDTPVSVKSQHWKK